MDRQKLGTILENKVVQKLKFSKNDNNKKPSSKLIFFNEKKNSERFRWFLTQKIDFESQILVLFDSSPLIQFSKFGNFI